jgi:NtrC-family two-component system response regulator AlgB
MREWVADLGEHAFSESPLLFIGERGSGKLEWARRLHEMSGRADRPFEVVDCATLEQAATATSGVRRELWRARRGTVCLRHLDALNGETAAAIDVLLPKAGPSVRLVATATGPLAKSPLAGRFTASLKVPPLRERREDVQPLARLFLRHAAPLASLDSSIEAVLERYPWPGNVAELRNVVESLSFDRASAIGVDRLPPRLVGRAEDLPYVGGPFSIDELEEAHVKVVVETAARLEEAARILGIDASTLWRKRQRIGPKDKEGRR